MMAHRRRNFWKYNKIVGASEAQYAQFVCMNDTLLLIIKHGTVIFLPTYVALYFSGTAKLNESQLKACDQNESLKLKNEYSTVRPETFYKLGRAQRRVVCGCVGPEV